MANQPTVRPPGNSRQRRQFYKVLKTILSDQQEQTVSKTFADKILGWIEQPLFINPVAVLAGLIGMFIFTPILAVVGICVMLAFHRAGVVRDWNKRGQVAAYFVLFLVTTYSLHGTGIFIKHRVPQLATRDDIAAMFQRSPRTPTTAPILVKDEPTPTPSLSPHKKLTPIPGPSAADIAAELAKLVPQQESERNELTKLRGDAISVINGLYSLYSQWEKRDHSLQGRLISDVSEARQKGVQYLRNNNNQEISDRYFRDYHARAINVRDSLLGHIPHSPIGRDERADESYFPMQGRNAIWIPDIGTQTCDLIKLLNEMESEHSLQLSVTDIRQSLHCH